MEVFAYQRALCFIVAPDSYAETHRAELSTLLTDRAPGHQASWFGRNSTPSSTSFLFFILKPNSGDLCGIKVGIFEEGTRCLAFTVEITTCGSNWQGLDCPSTGGELWDIRTDAGRGNDTFRLPSPVACSAVRITPRVVIGHCSLRVDLLVKPSSRMLLPVSAFRQKFCAYERGFAVPFAPDHHNFHHRAELCMLSVQKVTDSSQAWCAREAQPVAATYLQFTLKQPLLVHSILTKGRGDADQWVMDFTVEVTCGGSPWQTLQSPTGTDAFQGNTDRDTLVTNHLVAPMLCDAVRLRPLHAQGHCSMRADIVVKSPT